MTTAQSIHDKCAAYKYDTEGQGDVDQYQCAVSLGMGRQVVGCSIEEVDQLGTSRAVYYYNIVVSRGGRTWLTFSNEVTD